MAKPRFADAVTKVYDELLQPKGFGLVKHLSPGFGMYAFVRPRNAGLLEGIGVTSGLLPKAFLVELGVFPSTSEFYRAALVKTGRWREIGLRIALGQVVHGAKSELTPNERDFFAYQDQETLFAELRKAISMALEHGPSLWDKFARNLSTGAL